MILRSPFLRPASAGLFRVGIFRGSWPAIVSRINDAYEVRRSMNQERRAGPPEHMARGCGWEGVFVLGSSFLKRTWVRARGGPRSSPFAPDGRGPYHLSPVAAAVSGTDTETGTGKRQRLSSTPSTPSTPFTRGGRGILHLGSRISHLVSGRVGVVFPAPTLRDSR
jgi:hypothetical protein